MTTTSVVGPLGEVVVGAGPLLLAGIGSGPGLPAHTARLGPLPELSLAALLELARAAAVRGRGGAGFPFARKLEAAARGRRPVVVVNAAEGEPASAKDLVLLALTPHQVLDGAVLAARALAAREVHVVTSADRPAAAAGVDAALRERSDRGIRWRRHVAAPRFVSGQGRAVLELMAGREGLPVTAWQPEAVRGHRGRPTLLSNAETFAQLGALVRVGSDAYAAHGTDTEPGTSLLTVVSPVPGAPTRVVEVGHGTNFAEVLDAGQLAGPCLVGGYHGTWTSGAHLAALPVSALALRAQGLTLGAGVVLPLGASACPVARTAELTAYLAGESAGRCGPCRNGLPALASAVRDLASGSDTRARIAEVTGLVTGRGACAHPDGTTRLVGSLVHGLPALVEAHLVGRCACGAPAEDVA
ncbi:MAG: NADH-ubiquinone oxidoreductase-F iron-sulfur binding region domain-containing protein [Terracoccus sp.]